MSGLIIVLFNFGWPNKAEGGYIRKGGHWVVVVGAEGSNEFPVYNQYFPKPNEDEE